ncbi:MAG TPA: enolase C-terminal domain-like protein [Polyangiaceae bacterium]
MARLRISAFEVPTSSPEADGTLAWSNTVLVTVELTLRGQHGFGYSYADVPTAAFVKAHLAPIVLAADPLAVGATFDAMSVAVRNVGRDGVAATAMSAVDMACWDVKARLLGRPLVDLLGARRSEIAAYGSGGFTTYGHEELRRQLAGWKDEGFTRVKMKIGDSPDTLDRVRVAREAIGDRVELFVDANGAYRAGGAVAIAAQMASLGVTWFEEPVSSDDLEGLRFVREHAPPGMLVAAGEYGYRSRTFDRMLAARSVDVLQADATRCGVSGFLSAAALCEARGVPLSAHCAPTIHAHLGCAASNVVHVEYFHDHTRLEGMLFDGAARATGGVLRPDRTRPGIGVVLRRADAARFQVYDETLGDDRGDR